MLQNLKSIAISITKSRKYCNTYCKISKVLQYFLQNKQNIAISITKSQSIAILLEPPLTVYGYIRSIKKTDMLRSLVVKNYFILKFGYDSNLKVLVKNIYLE